MLNKPVKTIAVSGGKGGIGKTNVAVNLSVALAQMGRSVCLFDADLGLSNVDVMLGLNVPFNLSHVLLGEKSLTEIMIRGPSGIGVIPGGNGIQSMSHLSELERGGIIAAFSELSDKLDILVIDTSAGISRNVGDFCCAAQQMLVVICDEPASLTDAYALIKVMFKEYGVERFKVLCNMVDMGAHGRNLFDRLNKVTQRFLPVHLEYAGHIPFDEHLKKSVQKRRSVLDAYPRSKASVGFKNLAVRADRWPLPMAAAGHLEFFVERLIEASRLNAEVST